MSEDGKTDTDADELKGDDEENKNSDEEKTLAEELAGNEDKDNDKKDKDSEADESKKDQAPDEYEDFSLPENFESVDDMVVEFKTLAKELNLSQDVAQKLIDMQIKVQTRSQEMLVNKWTEVQKEWEDKSRNDKEYGGKEFDTSLGHAKTALDKFASKAFREALEETGMGNHPELIRFLVSVGKGIGEDDVMKEGTSPGGNKTPAEIMFPDMNKGDN